MEQHLADKVSSILEMRRFPAVKGYRELHEAMKQGIADKHGLDALRGLMLSMRRYARERPGMSAATFRTPQTDCPDWRDAQMQLAGLVFSVLAELGIRDEAAFRALRIMRSFVRGFVLHEMGASFLEPLEHDESYALGVEIFIQGLAPLRK